MLGGLAIETRIKNGLRSDHFLQNLERRELHDVLSGLGSKPLLFAGEGVLAEATLGSGLAVLANLHEAWDGEGAGAATTEVLLHHACHGVKHTGDFLASQAGIVSDFTVDLSLGAWLGFGGCLCLLLCGLLLGHVQESFLLLE